MNASEWEASAAALAAEQAGRSKSDDAKAAKALGLALPTPGHMREAIVELVHLLLGAPETIQQRYKAIDEARLRALADDARAILDAGAMRWLAGDLVEAAGAQLRAYDRMLLDHGDIRGKPSDANRDFLCARLATHVIPRFAAKPPPPHLVTTMTARRRALVWHRLIPQKLGDYSVDLQWHPDLSLSFRREHGRVFAALFEDVTLVRDNAFANFVATDCLCADEKAAIAAQVESAYAGDVTIAVWPELTMPPPRRAKLAAALRDRALRTEPGAGPIIVAAGSWHDVEGDDVRNRMHVMSALGVSRFVHDKTLAMESATLGVEQITPSWRIPVLIADDALIGFAICRDFCELQITRVYEELDVDLIVVPSYGDTNTILSHRQQAEAIATSGGTRAFVVQQIVPGEVTSAGVGFVLPPDGKPAALTADRMRAKAPGQRQPISFKKV